MARNSRSPLSQNESARARGPADHRDEIVAAALVGTVLVLLGYASGIGGGSGPARASSGSAPNTVALVPAPASSGPSPVIVQATGGSGGGFSSGYGAGGGYGGYGGDGGGQGPAPAANPGGASGPTPAPSSTPSASSPDPVIVGGSPSASPGGTASGGSGQLTCLLGSTSAGLLPTDPAGLTGILSGVTSTVGSVLGGLLGPCPAASPTPSAP